MVECPGNDGPMLEFVSDTDGYECDICFKAFGKGTTFWGCTPCGYDMCRACCEQGKRMPRRRCRSRARLIASRTSLHSEKPIQFFEEATALTTLCNKEQIDSTESNGDIDKKLRHGVEWDDLGALKREARRLKYNKSSWSREIQAFKLRGDASPPHNPELPRRKYKPIPGWMKVVGPDGEDVYPSHEPPASGGRSEEFCPLAAQLVRDPDLLLLDNISRVPMAELQPGVRTWTEPFIITGAAIPLDERLSRAELLGKFADVVVKTGNRNTLVHQGFVYSQQMTLGEALDSDATATWGEFGRIVFNSVKGLPERWQSELAPFVAAFPYGHTSYTLTVAGEGFGIGFHRHAAAMFLLCCGRKKWYLGPRETQDNQPTHPDFYTTKSTHKCIQEPGEILYVPDQWFHEIFNLEYTAGIQAMEMQL